MEGLDTELPPASTISTDLAPDNVVPLAVALNTDFTNVTVGFAAYFKAQVEGQTTGNRWDFGDGALLTNRLEAVHTWQVPGLYAVRLTVFNDAYPGGVTATVTP